MTAWYLLCPGTIDDEMADILQTKRGVIDAVVDGNQLPDEPVSLAVVRALRERGRRADGPAADDDGPTGT